ncbi:ArnT family glycosyltransferase [Geovibrio ferrireducens]|uniref:ArnT family glycosyltransferase n=1 Tax=Geovibrio ferrireducens TaxID=46201 RepID=UPI00224599E2|nr:glycosyltransferase family 39 protein [Geovibrio ferrireducens]
MKSALKYLLLCLLIFFSFFFGAASNPLFDTSEGTFAQGSMTMAQGGDFLTPYMDGRPDFDNPPLIYWLQTASVNLFGAGELAFRLPSVLAACGWVLLILFFVKDTRNEEMAFNSAFIACSSVIVSVFAKLAVADILLNMFLAGSMFAVYRHFETGRKKYVYLAFAAAGLGAVTKGPVAALVPFAVSALFFLSAGRMKEWVRAVFSPVGIGIMLLVALPWYVVEYMEYGDAFINGFLAKNNPGRFSGAAEGQGGGFAYYIPLLLAGLLPGTSLLFSVLKRLRPLWNDFFSRYMMIWFFFVFIFFALSGTKLPHLILSGMTPLFILCAYVFNNHRKKVLFAVPVFIYFAVLLCLPLIIPSFAAKVNSTASAEMLLEAARRLDMSYTVPVAAMLAVSLVMSFIRTLSYRTFVAVLAFFTVISLNVMYIPLVADIKQAPVKEAALYTAERNIKVNLWTASVPSFNVYYGKNADKNLPDEGGFVFIDSDKTGKIGRPYVTIKEWAGYRLIQVAEAE